MIPDEAIELALIANWDTEGDQKERMRAALEAAAPYMQVVELAAEYRRGYRDGLTDRKQVTAAPREWEPSDPVE